MKKDKSGRLLRLILTAAVLLVMIPASVFAASDEGDFETEDDGSGGVVITDYKGTGVAVEIPDAIGGKKVTSIGDYAFMLHFGMTSITIPESVTSIGAGAFWDCSGLTSITIPESVTSIGKGAFRGCKHLTSITIPDSMTSIGELTFYECSNLECVIIPESVTSIGSNAFDGCSSLTSIMIPDSVTSIGYGAFSECSSLTSIMIPDSVTSMEKRVFRGCNELADIYYMGTEETWKGMTKEASVPEGATVHYLKVVEGQEAACTEDGWRSCYECNDCGVLYDVEKDAVIEDLEAWKKGEGNIPKLGHKTGEWQKDDNGHWLVCERCGEKVDAAEHAYGEWSVVTEAAGDTDGLEKRVCTVCGHEQTRAIPAPGSDPEDPEKPGDND